MRSRHASMSFITSVEARNTPKVQGNHSINVKNYDAFLNIYTTDALNYIIALIFYFSSRITEKL